MRKHFSGGEEQAQQMQWQISRWKNDLLSPPQALEQAHGDAVQSAAALVYEQYARHMKAYNALDFDDLILLPVRLFAQHGEIREAWQNRVRYLLVDEYQDTNATQYALVKQLVGARGALTVVGDDDQSIYAWRGAQPQNLALLQNDYPKLQVIKLEQNYRSAGCILQAANALIANNPHVFEKSLWSELGFGEPIRVLGARNEEHEAEWVASEIIHHHFKTRGKYSDYAILYRGNHQSRPFERVLREHRIPYFISGGTSFFAYTEVKDVMAYLRLVVNPDDDNAFLRIVNTPRREIGPSTLEALGEYANERNLSLFAASFELGLEQRLSARAVANLRRFAEWIVTLNDRALRGDAIDVVKDVVRESNYELWIRDNSEGDAAAERKMENVTELVAWLVRLSEQEGEEKTLADLVATMTLMDVLERKEEESTGDRVALMTLHAAKGLEFPHVFIAGMEEELLPHRNSVDDAAIEEERRLAYVGVTRAQKALTLSYATRRKKQGELIETQPSRFIAELPQDHLKYEGANSNATPEEKKEKGQAHLANLRGMLGR
jgi:ATP-dependent DNA helicase Rep